MILPIAPVLFPHHNNGVDDMEIWMQGPLQGGLQHRRSSNQRGAEDVCPHQADVGASYKQIMHRYDGHLWRLACETHAVFVLWSVYVLVVLSKG